MLSSNEALKELNMSYMLCILHLKVTNSPYLWTHSAIVPHVMLLQNAENGKIHSSKV